MQWYKGMFAGLAPIWIADPHGECHVDSRGIIGAVLFPVVDTLFSAFIFINSMIDPDYDAAWPMSYDPDQTFER